MPLYAMAKPYSRHCEKAVTADAAIHLAGNTGALDCRGLAGLAMTEVVITPRHGSR